MHIHVDRIFSTVARNLGLIDFSRYTDSWIEWSYEAEKLIGSMDTFVQKEITYDASGAKATGTITFTDNPVSGDSITLNGVALYFRNSTDLGEAKSPNEIEIGSDIYETLDNANAQYGLIQSLTGFINSSSNGGTITGTGKYINSAIYNYPEALNVADYFVPVNLVENGTFANASAWSFSDTGNTTASLSSNSFLSVNSGGGTSYGKVSQSETLVSGTTYTLTFDITAITTSNYINVYNKSDNLSGIYPLTPVGGVGNSIQATNSFSDTFTSDGTGGIDIWVQTHNDGDSVNIDNVVLKEATTQATVLTITAKEIGPQGNNYTISSDNANAKVSGLTLTGGKGIYRNQQITLPENNIKLLGVRVGTDDSDYEHAELRRTSAIHRSRVGKTTDDSQQRSFRYYIDGNRLNIQHDNLDEITIVYLAYPIDLRGWPMIKEGHETAVAQYIMWQMKLIEFYNGKLPQYITKELEKRWYFLCGKARGDDGMPTSEELKQIGNMWNTLVPVTNDKGRGLIDF